MQSIFHKKAIPLTLTPDPQGSPTKHFQMQSLRTKSCNSTKYHHELIIMVYPIQDTRVLQAMLTCFTALQSLSFQASLRILEIAFSLQIISVNMNVTQLFQTALILMFAAEESIICSKASLPFPPIISWSNKIRSLYKTYLGSAGEHHNLILFLDFKSSISHFIYNWLFKPDKVYIPYLGLQSWQIFEC